MRVLISADMEGATGVTNTLDVELRADVLLEGLCLARDELLRARPDRVELFEIPAVDVASTDLRRRLARGEDAGDLLPPAVARRVVERGLYHESC